MFFDARRYDLSRVGRYKYNKKLNLAGRIAGQQLTQPIINPLTGELMAEAGEVVSFEKAQEIDNAGVSVAFVLVNEKETKVISNGMVDIQNFVGFDAKKECGINAVSYTHLDVYKRQMQVHTCFCYQCKQKKG